MNSKLFFLISIFAFLFSLIGTCIDASEPPHAIYKIYKKKDGLHLEKVSEPMKLSVCEIKAGMLSQVAKSRGLKEQYACFEPSDIEAVK